MKRKYSTLDFYGGRGAVSERMTISVKEELAKKLEVYKKKRKRFLENITFETGFSEQQILGILSGATEVDYKLFEMVGEYLGIEINDVLGEPDLNNLDAKRYWENQMRVNPMLINAEKPNINKKKLKELEFRLYIKVGAIGELARAA